jgi:quercetin dioxygenase-like cupin family protein
VKSLPRADDNLVAVRKPVRHDSSHQRRDERTAVIYPGDALQNPVTGETLTFHRTAEETDGQAVLVETIVEPHGFVATAHIHPHQSERFEVLEGELGLRVGDQELIARPGDVVTVEAGTPHRFYNAGEQQARFLCEVRPALGFESLIETMFILAAEGKTNRKGMPNPLRLAVIAKAHFDTVRLPRIPAVIQQGGLAAGALLGRLVGYKPTYGTARRPLAIAPA